PPNVDAAMRLATSIFPRVLSRNPNAVLQLVGDGPPPALKKLATPKIIVTGRVPDMRPYLEAAAVIVAPLRMGGGIRIKVTDALFSAKPAVATTLAAEGLNVCHGREILLADDDLAFAQAIAQLLSNEQLRNDLSIRAHAWSKHFSETAKCAPQ